MNPVDIVLVQRDSSASGTIVDPDFDEPIGLVQTGSPVTIQGQINYGVGRNERLLRSRTGDIGGSSGHFVFRKTDLDDAGITLTKGDRVTSIAGVTVELEITEVRHESPLRGAFLLTYADFEEQSGLRMSR